MIAPRWSKSLRDVVGRPGRSALAVLAMAAGAFALGTLLFKQAILRPVLGSMYGNTQPASATLVLDRLDDALVDSVRAVPGVGEAEARPLIVARTRVGADAWVPVVLHVIRDFDRQRVDRFRPQDGAWPPAAGEVLLERSAVRVAAIERGGALSLRTAGGGERPLRFAGTVHAPGLAPAWMEHVVYGFVPWNSVLRGPQSGESAQIRIAVAEHPLDEGHIREVAGRVRAALERQGRTVARVDVPNPGRHPHADQMETFLYLVGAFALLGFVLGAVLMASLIHTLLAEQLKQVGVMKAIGATTRQIAGVYLAQVALLAAAALAVAIPLAWLAGRAYARFAAGILNADVTAAPFPVSALAAIGVVGLAVPLAIALGPVLRAARITVHQALGDDPAPGPRGLAGLDRRLAALGWIPRPLLLSIRTTFLRRGRLALTVTMLALGGAVFMAALNVSAAWNRAVVDDFARRRYDLAVRLAEAQPIDRIDAVLARLPSVARAEYWPGAAPYLIGPEGAAGSPVALVGPDPGSPLIAPRIVAGRWIQPGDTTAAVINQAVLARHPGLAVGGTVQVRQHGRTLGFPIVGVVKEMSPAAVIYAPPGAVLAVSGQSGDETRLVRVVARQRSAAGELAAAAEIERALGALDIEIAGIQRMLDARQGILDHLVIIKAILTIAATMVVLVGLLGLTSTLSVNVVQRTREIGVLGAIGATPRVITAQVWIESLVIALLSWLAAVVLAAPISWALEAVTGRMFFAAPLDFHLSPRAAAIWLALVLVLASLGSLYPARRAARLPIRAALTYT